MNLYFKGPFVLDNASINNNVPNCNNGNYELGFVDSSGSFIVRYVGRSDTDLKSRIGDHIGECMEYTHFKYVEQDTDKDAFDCECYYYHIYLNNNVNLNNKNHPDVPKNRNYKCPYCG